MSSIGLILGANVFVVGQLRLFGELFRAVRWSIAIVDCSADISQGVISALVSASMEKPIVVRRPQFLSRNKFLQTFHRRNRFVVTFFSGRSASRAVAFAEPIVWRPPNVRSDHVDAAPETIS